MPDTSWSPYETNIININLEASTARNISNYLFASSKIQFFSFQI